MSEIICLRKIASRLLFGLIAVFIFSIGYGSPQLGSLTAKELRLQFVISNENDFLEELLLRTKSVDNSTALDAVHSLGLLGAKYRDKIGDKVVEAMLPLLASDNQLKQYAAVTALQSYEKKALPALDKLMPIVEAGEPGVSFIAARIIGLIGEPANRAQDILVKALSSYDNLEAEAANSLCRIGRIKEDNISKIRNRLEHGEYSFKTKLGMASALVKNGVDDPSVANVFSLGISSTSADTRYLTLKSISECTLADRSWVLSLVTKIRNEDQDEYIRAFATKILAEVEGKGE